MTDQVKTTIARIYAAYEAAAGDGLRTRISASTIGTPCSRELWYSFRWATSVAIEGQALRRSETGRLSKPRVIENLRAAGVDVYETDLMTDQAYKVSAHGGHFEGVLVGMARGFAEDSDTWYALGCSTYKDKTFGSFKRRGLEKVRGEQYAELQYYMGKYDLPKAFYIGVNKDNDELHSEIIYFDKGKFQELDKKAGNIIASDRPTEKISLDPTFFRCKFCRHSRTCHGTAAPEINCRTCAHSTPLDSGDGAWCCEYYSCAIDTDTQKMGAQCPAHIYNPYLLENYAGPVGANPEDNSIHYCNQLTGKPFKNGGDGYSSVEIKATQDKKLLGSDYVDSAKLVINAEVTG